MFISLWALSCFAMDEKTIFLTVFGNSPVLRVMDFLVVNEDFDYSMTDVAKLSGIGYSTLKLFWGELEKNSVVTNTRTVGKAKMYKLNFANPVVKKFRDFYWETTRQQIRTTFVKKQIKITG